MTDEDGVVHTQVKIYDNGCVLVCDRCHVEDEFGGLSLVALDLDHFAEFEVDAATDAREAEVRRRRTR